MRKAGTSLADIVPKLELQGSTKKIADQLPFRAKLGTKIGDLILDGGETNVLRLIQKSSLWYSVRQVDTLEEITQKLWNSKAYIKYRKDATRAYKDCKKWGIHSCINSCPKRMAKLKFYDENDMRVFVWRSPGRTTAARAVIWKNTRGKKRWTRIYNACRHGLPRLASASRDVIEILKDDGVLEASAQDKFNIKIKDTWPPYIDYICYGVKLEGSKWQLSRTKRNATHYFNTNGKPKPIGSW